MGSPQWVSPFGDLGFGRLLTARPSLSQFPTSFIGTLRQGIHRKLLVASPRDTEKLILFLTLNSLGYIISYYSVVKVRLYHLTGKRCSGVFSRASVTLQKYSISSGRDKAARLIAGPYAPCDGYMLGVTLDTCFLPNFSSLLTDKLSGDGGI